MTREKRPTAPERIAELCVDFKLPTLGSQLCSRLSDGGFGEAIDLVAEVFEMEAHDRHERRVDRLRRASKLPPGKTFATLDESKLPKLVLHKARELATGAFLDGGTNVLCFGLPGRGKSHVACAIAHALIERGHSVLFLPTYQVVQYLLGAKRDLALPSMPQARHLRRHRARRYRPRSRAPTKRRCSSLLAELRAPFDHHQQRFQPVGRIQIRSPPLLPSIGSYTTPSSNSTPPARAPTRPKSE
jgi:hypothetical protein